MLEADLYPELECDKTGLIVSPNSSAGLVRYLYRSDIPYTGSEYKNNSTGAVVTGLTSSFQGKMWTALNKRGLISRNTNSNYLNPEDSYATMLRTSEMRLCCNWFNTESDINAAFEIISEEYDKLIAGYVKMKAQDVFDASGALTQSGSVHWLEADPVTGVARYLADADVHYLFNMNGNVGRDAPGSAGNNNDRMPSDEEDYQHQLFPSFATSVTEGLIPGVDASGAPDGTFVPGALTSTDSAAGKKLYAWTATATATP